MKDKKIYKVYYLPKCNYCGVTSRSIVKRLWEHKHKFNRDVSECIILGEFEDKKEAYYFERNYQIKNSAEGYIANDEWRLKQSERLLANPLHLSSQKKVIRIDTEEVFESISQCARIFNSSKGNLIKHLKGNKSHTTFCKLKFKYHEQ